MRSSLARSLRVLAAPALVAMAAGCGSDPTTTTPPADEDMSVPAAPDMAAPVACAQLGMTPRAWSGATPGTLRDSLAGDFSVTDQNGDWSLAQNWSGCESYVFIPDSIPASSLDSTSIWAADLDGLIAASPPNVHYFFISKKDGDAVGTSLDLVRSQVDAALASLPDGGAPGQKDWWRAHLHFVTQGVRQINNWVGNTLRLSSATSPVGGYGFAIDRFQHLRGVGTYADVNRLNRGIDPNKGWPFDNNLAYAANPPVYFNYEADRQARLDGEKNATVIRVYEHEVVTSPRPPAVDPDAGVPDMAGQPPYPPIGTVWKDVTFPDAQAMKGFDRLEVDLTMNCPVPDKAEENNNCGAWDYIVNIAFQSDDGRSWNEMARFISSYHRAGRYVVDATHFLPYLAKGGVQHMQYAWAPPWNEQPADTTMEFRLWNSGGGARPTQAAYLFSGGGFNQGYDTNRTPVSVMIPPTAKKVELRAIITGHGGATAANCSEFCDHHHEFTVGGMAFTKTFPEVGDQQGCMGQIDKGAVPNQSGTWWYGRGGWCPGMQVDPWIVDVTAQAPAGKSVSVSYRGLFNDKPPTTGLGDIDMTSWLVIWE